ncbi:MAG: Na(+)/H(+) antiporter subunit C [Actinomycetaceae bacterium]|nr:Na(+)/H(+) antiporter subunit C [Actinomycetaceae bacterium]
MNVPFVLLVIAGALVGCGVYIVLERTLSRIILGLGLCGNGVNVFLLAMSGQAGEPPLLGQAQLAGMVDPLPQAMILTSIVITMAVTAFGLALSYRSWRLVGHDEVVDDVEDRRLARRAALERMSERLTEDFDETDDADINYDEDEGSGQAASSAEGHRDGVTNGAQAGVKAGRFATSRQNKAREVVSGPVVSGDNQLATSTANITESVSPSDRERIL